MKKYFTLLLFTVYSFSQTSISGKVTSKDESLPFATVYLIELSKGVTTQENGQYKLENIPNGKYTLQFSFTGFKSVKKNNHYFQSK